MKIIKTGIALLILSLGISIPKTRAQDNNRAGIVRFQGTLGAGYMTRFKALHVLLHGDLEYFFNERISVRSDISYSLAFKNDDPVPPFKFNHTLLTGVGYHLTPGKPVDFYVGFQPGVAIAKRRYEQLEGIDVPIPLPGIQTTVDPLISLNTGITYFGNRFFNAFVHVKYLAGYHHDNYTTASLQEFRISFGLGFFFRTKKS